jgi:hypothetical protein
MHFLYFLHLWPITLQGLVEKSNHTYNGLIKEELVSTTVHLSFVEMLTYILNYGHLWNLQSLEA